MRLLFDIVPRCIRVLLIGTLLAATVDLTTNSAKAQGRPSKATVDLNSSSEAELEALPGVGPATARKIVAGRPYKSVEELSRAGLSAKAIESLKPVVKVSPASSPRAVSRTTPGGTTGKTDLNSASEAELEALPGVGPATAKKIVAARPYRSIEDLSRAGLSARTIDGLKPLVKATPAASASSLPATVSPKSSSAAAGAPAAATGTSQGRSTAKEVGQQQRSTASRPGASSLINLNTASMEELEALPGIGPVKAKAIMDARPFSAPEEVMKVKGIKEGEFSKIKDLISVR